MEKLTRFNAMSTILNFGKKEERELILAGKDHEAYQIVHARHSLILFLNEHPVKDVLPRLNEMTTVSINESGYMDYSSCFVHNDLTRYLLIKLKSEFGADVAKELEHFVEIEWKPTPAENVESVTRAWKVYGASARRQKLSFSTSVVHDFSCDNNIRIIELENSDKNDHSIIRITRNTAAECERELWAQITDGVFENCQTNFAPEEIEVCDNDEH